MKSDPSIVNRAIVEDIIQKLIDKLNTYYIFPEVAEEISDRLQKYLNNGTYDDIHEGEFLAYALTAQLQEVNNDQHLWVRWHSKALPDHAGSLLQNSAKVEEWKQKGRLDNFGIHQVERLSGNIGFLDIRYFYRTSWGSSETIVATLKFFSQYERRHL